MRYIAGASLFPYIAFDFSSQKWYDYNVSDRFFRRDHFLFFDILPKEVTHSRVGGIPTKRKERKEFIMKKIVCIVLASLIMTASISLPSSATDTYIVKKGDSLWTIAVQYQVGLSEIKAANKNIKNYDLIYPGQKINIPTVSFSITAYENEVVRLVNQKRAEHGLKPLTPDWQLSRVARYKSQDMKDIGYFSHTSPTYGSPFDMMKKFGISYRSAGENIAKGYATPTAVVNAWMNSPGHRANILNSSYTHIGVGYVSSGNYWTQMFISK